MSETPNITASGAGLICRWLKALQQRSFCEQRLKGAMEIERETEKALAEWIKPPDAKPGEKISVWYGDSLFQVVVGITGTTEDVVSVRYKGSKFQEILIKAGL